MAGGTVVAALDAVDGVTGQKTVTTAGTPVQLTASTRPLSEGVLIRAKAANNGYIYVGFGASGVSSTLGYELSPGESTLVPVKRADGIWIDSSVSGEGVCFMLI